jgi:hypothetical protein
MKKIIISLTLLASSLCVSQNTYLKKYTSGSIVTNDKVVASWINSELTVAFYGSPSNDIVFYYQNGSTKKYHQLTIGDLTKGIDGKNYHIIICNNLDIDEQIALQVYESYSVIRFILPNGYVEFKK